MPRSSCCTKLTSQLTLFHATEKRYTLILKDSLLPRNPDNGREQSTISYEYDFHVDSAESTQTTKLFVPWSQLKATYRGREKRDVPKINLQGVRRVSFMMRR